MKQVSYEIGLELDKRITALRFRKHEKIIKEELLFLSEYYGNKMGFTKISEKIINISQKMADNNVKKVENYYYGLDNNERVILGLNFQAHKRSDFSSNLQAVINFLAMLNINSRLLTLSDNKIFYFTEVSEELYKSPLRSAINNKTNKKLFTKKLRFTGV